MVEQVHRRDFLRFAAGSATALAGLAGRPLFARPRPSAGDAFEQLDALGLAEQLRSGRVTAAELVERVITRLGSVQPKLNCLSVDCSELARKLAADPPQRGPFAGVPILMKDLALDYVGTRTTHGSMLFRAAAPAADDSLVVRRMKQAGFILTGKTTTPEFGWSLSTETKLHGITRNPWHLDHTPGGSSGGSAAAVAAGVLPLAWASDGAGSIRVPASNCGLVGLKPTRGLIPQGPDVDRMYGASTEGCVSRSVRDTAAFLDALKGSLPGDPYQLPPGGSLLAACGETPRRLRIGVTTVAPSGKPTDPECVKGTESVAALLANLGHHVEPMRLDFDYAALKRDFITMVAVGAAPMYDYARQLLGRPPTSSDLSPVALEVLEHGNSIGGAQFDAIVSSLRGFSRTIAAQCAPYDVVLTPTMPETPARIGHYDSYRLTAAAFHDRFFHGNCFAVPFNVSGLPAMTLPLHWSKAGLPVGVQIVGRWNADADLFRLARQLEQARPWAGRRPLVQARG